MNKRKSLSKAEIGLLILILISVPLYALALKRNDIFTWLYIGNALAIMAWAAIFILPDLLKKMKQERKRKE